MTSVIDLSAYRERKSTVVSAPVDLRGMCHAALDANTSNALFREALEQAYIEQHGGPLEQLNGLPIVCKPIPANVTPDELNAHVIKLKAMVLRTRELLLQYLAAYQAVSESPKPHGQTGKED
jgi:hypothetical protein